MTALQYTAPCELCGIRAVIGLGFTAPCSGSPSGTHKPGPLPTGAVVNDPTPHSYETLDRLEREQAARKAEWRAACAVLGALWDRADAGEGGLDDETKTARLAASDASDALDDARAAFVAEWKRVGSPLDRHLDKYGERTTRRR